MAPQLWLPDPQPAPQPTPHISALLPSKEFLLPLRGTCFWVKYTHARTHTQNTPPHHILHLHLCKVYTCIKAPAFIRGSCTCTCTGPPHAHSSIRDKPTMTTAISLLPIALHTPRCSFPGGPLPLDRGRVFLAGNRVPGHSGSGGLGMGGSSPAQ